MKFLSFEFIPLMLLPSLVLLYLVLTNKSMIERLFDSEVLAKLKIDQGLSKEFRITLLFLALFAMIVAMARPVYQKGLVEVQSCKADVVVALDISRSMLAKDYYPNRLEFGKKKIEEFIQRSRHLRIGLLAFAKDAFIVSPITADKDALLFLLHKLDTKYLSLKGTNILAALMSAKLLFGQKSPKNLLLVTDGGDQKDFSQEIAYAKKEGFRVSVLGVATKKGAPIEVGGQLLKDTKGHIVISRLNEHIADLAKATGGIFVQATLDQKDIERLLRSFGDLKKDVKIEKIVDQVELYPYFLAFALLFLALAFFTIPSRLGVAVVALLVSYQAQAGLTDFKLIKEAKEAYQRGAYKEAADLYGKIAKIKGSAQSYYDWGDALYKAGRYDEAIKVYNKVQTSDKELEFRKLHNLGNSYFKLQKYKKAIQMYQKALRIKNDPDTQYNLELAKKMLQKKRQKKSNKQNQGPKKQPQKPKEQKSSQKGGKKNQQKQKNGEKKPTKQEAAQTKPQPISDREEKKWLKMIQRHEGETLLYKAPIKVQKRGNDENPW